MIHLLACYAYSWFSDNLERFPDIPVHTCFLCHFDPVANPSSPAKFPSMPDALANSRDIWMASAPRDQSATCPRWACSLCPGTEAAAATEGEHGQFPDPLSRTSPLTAR